MQLNLEEVVEKVKWEYEYWKEGEDKELGCESAKKKRRP